MERLSGWTLFTIRGVAVKIHISLLFLLLYVILIATASFPFVVEASGINSAEIVGSPFLWAVVFSVSLVISIFLHELSHVLVAQSRGIRVRRITLMMLGGVSHMERIPEDPATEFKVAIIGPIVSLAIAAVLFWVRTITDSTNLALFSFWVGQTNLALGIFNLLPAFPTDGGRVLRSFLVTRFGRLRGTQMAVKVSHVFAWIFGILGVFQFNLLLILIAFFIYGASRSELFVLMGQTILKGMKASDIMVPITAISENSPLSQVANEMTLSKHLVLPVIGTKGSGSAVSSEMIRHIPKNLWNETLVKDIAIQVPKAVDINDPLEEVWEVALTNPVGGIPVTDSHQIVGIIKTSDLLEAFELRQLDQESHTSATVPWPLKAHHPRFN